MAPVAMIVYKRRVVGSLFPRTSNSLITKDMRYDWASRGIERNDQVVLFTDLLYMHKVR